MKIVLLRSIPKIHWKYADIVDHRAAIQTIATSRRQSHLEGRASPGPSDPRCKQGGSALSVSVGDRSLESQVRGNQASSLAVAAVTGAAGNTHTVLCCLRTLNQHRWIRMSSSSLCDDKQNCRSSGIVCCVACLGPKWGCTTQDKIKSLFFLA